MVDKLVNLVKVAGMSYVRKTRKQKTETLQFNLLQICCSIIIIIDSISCSRERPHQIYRGIRLKSCEKCVCLSRGS